MDIGIDLGTTFSVMAVKGQVHVAKTYGQGTYLPECDVTILPSPNGDPTFPSVMWWDSEYPKTYVFGIDAKQKAEEGKAPIMFSKRSIGTTQELMLNGRSFTAKEVASRFLRYLKECAEQALGEPVRRAVVTHPAYFDRNQVQETLEAATSAGFEMTPAQMMMEPCAAALAYTLNDVRDPLRVLTYDLGGGTFDVTVLEKRDGVITMKAFNGDHLLGGYNFDRAFVEWVRGELKAQGREIPYDQNSEEDRGRRARLLQLAETVKIQLTQQRTSKAPVSVKVDFLVDAQGKRVQFVGKINRDTYASLIRDLLATTIDCCNKVLASAQFSPSDLDAVLLVGGSTYGQWIQEAVQAAFPVSVEPYNPDLCVAAGAAIEAAKLPKARTVADVELLLDVRPVSALPTTNVRGQLRPTPGGQLNQHSCAQLVVMLTTPDGRTLGPAPIGSAGDFLFEDIDLEAEENESVFSLSISDGTRELVKETFSVRYQPEGAAETPINTVLPKPIYVKTASGLVAIADEGVPLPARCEIRLKKLFGDNSVTVDVLQEFEKVGEIQVNDLPDSAVEGCPIIITVEVTQKNEMRGTAKVVSRTGSVLAERDVRLTFPPIPVPDISELYARFGTLLEKREQVMHLTQDPEQRLALAGAGEKLVVKIQKLLNEQQADRQELDRELKKLDHLVNPPADDMEPSRNEFQVKLEDCRSMLSGKPNEPNLQAFHPRLKRIEKEANDAYTTKNRKKWAAANESLNQEHSRIRKLIEGGDGPPPPTDLPPTPILKDDISQRIDGLRAALIQARDNAAQRGTYEQHDRSRCDQLEREIDAMQAAVEKISDDLDPKAALAQMQLIMRPANTVKEKTRYITEGTVVGR